MHCAAFTVAFLTSASVDLQLRNWASSRVDFPGYVELELLKLVSKLWLDLVSLHLVLKLDPVPRTRDGPLDFTRIGTVL